MRVFFKTFLLVGAPCLTAVSIYFILYQIGNGGYFDVRNWRGLSRFAEIQDYSNGSEVFFVLLICTSLLVAVNTTIFLGELVRMLEKSNSSVGASGRYISAIVVIILTIVNVGWPISIIFGLDDGTLNHEYVVLFLFSGFALVDFFLMRSRSQEVDKYGNRIIAFEAAFNQKLEIEAEDIEGHLSPFDGNIGKMRRYFNLRVSHLFYRHNLYFVDLPVCIAVVLVLIFSERLEHLSYVNPFANGLAAGSLIMHLTMSQIIFIIVALQSTRREMNCKAHIDRIMAVQGDATGN